jgi:dipeptidyl aminopeptidase/acylaminoacyl peptidase
MTARLSATRSEVARRSAPAAAAVAAVLAAIAAGGFATRAAADTPAAARPHAAASAPMAAAPAAGTSRLAPESLREITWVADPQFSPDGRRVAFVRANVDAAADDYSSDLWIVDGDAAPRALTADPAEDLLPRWSPDGTRLAFVSKRSGKRQVHVLELAGGEPWQLTAVEDGIANFEWSPDGARIAFTSVTPLPEERERLPPEADPASKQAKPPFVTERLRTRSDGTPGWTTAKRMHVWTVRTDAGPNAKATRVTRGDYDHREPQWSADGTQLYFTSVRKPDADYVDTDTEIYVVPADGGAEPRALTDRRGPDETPAISPDGRWIAYTGFDEKTPPASYTQPRLYLLDTRTGASRQLAARFDRAIMDGTISDMGAPRGDGARLVWRADSKAVYFQSADRGQAQIYEATLDGKYRQLTQLAQGEVRAFDVSRDGRVAAVHSSPMQPPELRAFALRDAARDGAWRPVTAFNAELAAGGRLVPYEEIWYEGAKPSVTTFEGQAKSERQWIQGWILKPPGFDTSRQYPMVLYIHGGPHAMYGTGFFHEFQVLANQGYVVLITNPRGSTGYGEEFANVVQYRYPGDDYHDLMAGVDAVVARGYVDTKRMAVGGGSGGGLLTSWTIAHTDRFAAALVERAVTNWHGFVGTADGNYWFATRWFRDFPWRDVPNYLDRSPLSFVDAVKTPVLVLHNADDFRTPLDQGLQYYAALKMVRKPAKLAVFPDSSHGMSRNGRPSQRVTRMELILDWFGQHTGMGGDAGTAAGTRTDAGPATR